MGTHSSYAKREKSPHRYSAHYNTWKQAVRNDNAHAAEDAAQDHERQWGYTRYQPNSNKQRRT